MVKKKNISWPLMFSILFFILLLAYLIGGVTKVDGISLNNWGEGLAFVVTHPFRNWWNPEKTPGFLGLGVIVWFMITGYLMDYYRNFQYGIEKGSEEWGDIPKMKKNLQLNDKDIMTKISKNITVTDKVISNSNMLVIGGSGSYKTTSVLTPNLFLADRTNVFLDIKGDLLRKHGKFLESKGITVKSLNLINFSESDRYNPFLYVETEADIIKLITNIQESCKPPDAMKGDPFWDDGVKLYLNSMFLYEWLDAKDNERPPTMNNILKLVNMESQKENSRSKEKRTLLQVAMDELAEKKEDPNYPPVREYRKLKEGATETVRSIIIMVNAQLQLFELPQIKRIMEADDIDIPSLGEGIDGNPTKKTALFLVMPDNEPSFNLIISMFYTQLFDVLMRIADHKYKGSLPIHVRLWADEFYAGPKPRDPEKLMGTIRSRNMSIVPILQDIAQIKTLFQNDKWEIFTGNCAVTIYLGAGPTAYGTHKWISDMLGEMTIDTRNDNKTYGTNGSVSLNNGKEGRLLMTPAEVKRLPRQQCIVFIEGQRPIIDYKALPFNTEDWKLSSKLAGKNGYKNPVEVIYDAKSRTYRTNEGDKGIMFLSSKELPFYKELEKKDNKYKVFEMTEADFLYTKWDVKPRPTEEDIKKFALELKEKNIIEYPEPEPDQVQDEEDTLDETSKDVMLLLNDNIRKINAEQYEEIMDAIEMGFTDEQLIKMIKNPTEVKRLKQIFSNQLKI